MHKERAAKDHECIRNCSVNGNYRVWRLLCFVVPFLSQPLKTEPGPLQRSADVQLPPRAEIKFDYCSPFHPKQGGYHHESGGVWLSSEILLLACCIAARESEKCCRLRPPSSFAIQAYTSGTTGSPTNLYYHVNVVPSVVAFRDLVRGGP